MQNNPSAVCNCPDTYRAIHPEQHIDTCPVVSSARMSESNFEKAYWELVAEHKKDDYELKGYRMRAFLDLPNPSQPDSTLIPIIEKALREGSKYYAGKDNSWTNCAEHILNAILQHSASQPGMAEQPVGLTDYLISIWPLREDFNDPCSNARFAKYASDISSLLEREYSKPTEAMCDEARGFIMGMDLNIRNWQDMEKHLDRGGYSCIPYIREMAAQGQGGHITKWDVADCIWQLMSRAAPIPSPKPAMVSRSFSEIAEEYHYAKSNLEDKMCNFGMTDWDAIWTDPYDNSIEFSEVAIDDRLSPEAQQYLVDKGFSRCWLNHVDNMETYYVFDGEHKGEYHRPSPLHRRKNRETSPKPAQPELAEALVEALEEIANTHDGNQSPALNMPDLDYARRTIRNMNCTARQALAQYRAATGKSEGE